MANEYDREALSQMASAQQKVVMQEWFLNEYEDPVHELPHDSGEGGYIWVNGGPFDAAEVLEEEFGGIVPAEIIQELVDELNGMCLQWSPRRN